MLFPPTQIHSKKNSIDSANTSKHPKTSTSNSKKTSHHSHQNLITLFISAIFASTLFFTGCANESVYRGGLGAFKDYEALASYRSVGKSGHFAHQVFENERLEKAFGRDFSNRAKNTSFGKLFEQNFNASNAPIDSFSGAGASLMYGMRESDAIQRATMRPYQIAGKWYYPTKVKISETFDGIASWYGPNFHAKKTHNRPLKCRRKRHRYDKTRHSKSATRSDRIWWQSR